MDSSLIVPITLWSGSEPNFHVSSICLTSDLKNLVTGSHEGQICIWDLNIEAREIVPRVILIGHINSITCLVSTNEFIISSCEGGKMCRWNIEDGYCEKSKDSLHVHRNIQLIKSTITEDELLFTSGDYSDIIVYNSVTLQTIFNLFSKNHNWISNFHISLNKTGEVVCGVTPEGCIRIWQLDKDGKSQCEVYSKNLFVENVVDLKYNSERTYLLIVTMKYWCLFDAELFHCVHKVQCNGDEKLLGGNFCDSDGATVVVTNSGKFYIHNEEKLTSIILDSYSKVNVYTAAITFINFKDGKNYFFKCTQDGQLNIWSLNSSLGESDISLIKPCFSKNLNHRWISSENCFFDKVIQFTSVTCCIYVFELDRFFLGCANGKIVILPGVQSIMAFYFCSNIQKPFYEILPGHNGKINCLVYPRAKYPHYNEAHLVSGGKDFSVCLWDIFKMELLHKFCVQCGEIIRFVVPPDTCYNKVRHSICSVSSNHSVAILNLTDQRCVILTPSHLFPIISLSWMPYAGFLIVECFDGSVYVWDVETGLLDRILDGVEGQEVLYACKENNFSNVILNFYILEKVCTKNSMKREFFHTLSQQHLNSPVGIDGFLVNENCECQIFTCNLEYLIKILNTQASHWIPDVVSCEKLYLLTQVLSSELSKKPYLFFEKIKHRTEKVESNDEVHKAEFHMTEEGTEKDNEKIQDSEKHPGTYEKLQNIIRFLLSSLHIWGLDSYMDDMLVTHLGFLKPDIELPIGIVSRPGTYSLFFPNVRDKVQSRSSSLLSSTCIFMTALAQIFKCSLPSSFSLVQSPEVREQERKDPWEELYMFYEGIFLNRNETSERSMPKLKVEILAKAWLSKCLPLRKTIRKILPSHLETLLQHDYSDVLEFWYRFLPHFKVCGKTLEKSNFENLDMKLIALVLFGTVGSDLKFKMSPTYQEDYIYQTCSSLVYLLLQPHETEHKLSQLQSIAIDFIGRGYIVWEQFLKMEKIFPILFQMCQNTMKYSFQCGESPSEILDKCLSAHDALKAIALARTSAFIKCLTNEINQMRMSPSNRTDGFLIENCKPEILSIIVFLLEKTPYIMLLYLNEVVATCTFCIDSTHLKQSSLSELLPVMVKFRQVHHSLTGQRIAVGLGTGSIVLHDLRSGKSISTQAHNDCITALKFSDDGKHLASYSCYENRLSFWQVLTGMFGLGPTQLKSINSFQTYMLHDEEIRNHLEIADLTWTGTRSIVLKLCDGTENTFQF
ncbi:hypothetical protein RUM43_014264 [Polyplax serrata]|uniref:WD repeat-containing protein 7 n=1 Tax=Polyplax serrata TaxID=468196 RepID=A0AAN8PH27_POLSC